MDRKGLDVASFKYRAFISYSREDRGLVDDLYQRLTKWRAPGPLLKREGQFGKSPRSLSVYVDRKSQESGGALSSGLRGKLEQSAFLVVVCSRAGADPNSWVTREIEHFLKIASPDRIIPIIIREDADQPLEEVLPAPLLALGEDGPIGADLLHDGGVVPVTHKIIGGLTGFSQNEIAREQEIADTHAQRTARRIIVSISVLFFVASISTYFAMQQRNQALSTESSILASHARSAVDDSATDIGLMLALEGAPSGKGVVFDRPQNDNILVQLSNALYKNRIVLTAQANAGERLIAALSPDGERAAITSSTGRTTVLDVETGAKIATISPNGTAPVGSIFSNDGRFLVLVSHRRVDVYDVVTGERQFDLQLPYERPFAIFSADSRRLYVGNIASGKLEGWEIDSEQPTSMPAGSFKGGDSLASRGMVVEPDGVISVFELNSGSVVARIDPRVGAEPEEDNNFFGGFFIIADGVSNTENPFGKVDNIGAMAKETEMPRQPIQFGNVVNRYALENNTLVKYSYDPSPSSTRVPKISVWDILDPEGSIYELKGAAISLSHDGRYLAYVERRNCELQILDLFAELETRIRKQLINRCDFGAGAYAVGNVIFSPDSKYAMLLFSDGIFLQSLKGISEESAKLSSAIPLLHDDNERVIDAGFDIESANAYTVTDGSVRVWNPKTGDSVGRLNGAMQAVDRAGRLVATIGEDRAVRLSELAAAQKVLSTHPGSAFFSRDRKLALMVDQINENPHAAYILAVSKGQILSTLPQATKPFAGAAFTLDGARVITLSRSRRGVSDNFLEIWDVKSGNRAGMGDKGLLRLMFPAPLQHFKLVDEDRSIVALDVDNQWYKIDVVSGRQIWRHSRFRPYTFIADSQDQSVSLLTQQNGTQSIIWDPGEDKVLASTLPAQGFAISRDKGLIAVASGNEISVLGRMQDGSYQVMSRYTEHDAVINSLRFNRAGTVLLSASADNTALLMDLITASKVGRFREPGHHISSAEFNSRDTKVLTVSPSGFVRVWDIASGRELVSIPVETRTTNFNWFANLVNDDREIAVSTVRSTRRWALPPEYNKMREIMHAACGAMPKGATLETEQSRLRYNFGALKGEGGNPCAHYGLLHWKYYRAQWCSAVGYGCAGEGGWLRSVVGRRVGGQ